jgi:SAM-dependent methyltransferase
VNGAVDILPTMDRNADHALSFGAAADLYDRNRPSYPPEALAWVLGDAPRRVVDLGAGTGILTRGILALGHEVIPVEPDPGMRARLAEATPGTQPLAGTAEEIPLPDGAADAVVAGQSYHWFNTERAHPEIARVLRPGGVFAPIWNFRDESVPWVARLTEIVAGEGSDSSHEGSAVRRDREHFLVDPDFGPWFGPVETGLFRHDVGMTADGLASLIATRSYYLTASPERQEELLAQVRAMAEELPERFALPYITAAYRAERVS